jgi:hypothetical protein
MIIDNSQIDSVCSLVPNSQNNCLSNEAIKIIASKLGAADNKLDIIEIPKKIGSDSTIPKKIGSDDVSQVKAVVLEKLNCTDDYCVFKNNLVQDILPEKIKEKEKLNFKPEGPRDTTKWINSVNIHEVMLRWSVKFTNFKPLDISMIDFEDYDSTLRDFKVDDLYKNNMGCAACILNTDVHTGQGLHWIALFVDIRNDTWSIEYFNSSGNPPHNNITKWQMKIKYEMLNLISKNNLDVSVEIVIASNIRHQQTNTECGNYALYYAYSRLNDISYSRFAEEVIPDSDMIKFRKVLFNSE